MIRIATVASSVSLAAWLGTAACSGGPGTPAPSPPTETRASAAEVQPVPRHGPARAFFRQVAALDLRDDQQVAVSAIQDQLAADMVPQRESVRQAILRMADAVELGELDATKVAEQKAMLSTVLGEAKALDPAQRVALVEKLQKQHDPHTQPDAEHSHGLAKLAYAVGLTEQQQAKIKEALNAGLDDLFPDRKTRREEWEAKMKAMGEAFVTDDFDAADFDLAGRAGEVIASSVEIASRAIDVSNRVLSGGQRRLAAEWIRGKADEL
jgi:hypothetical protein